MFVRYYFDNIALGCALLKWPGCPPDPAKMFQKLRKVETIAERLLKDATETPRLPSETTPKSFRRQDNTRHDQTQQDIWTALSGVAAVAAPQNGSRIFAKTCSNQFRPVQTSVKPEMHR